MKKILVLLLALLMALSSMGVLAESAGSTLIVASTSSTRKWRT